MSEIPSENVSSKVLAACQAGQGDVAEALARAFEDRFEVASDEATSENWDLLTERFRGPGLLLTCLQAEIAWAIVLPVSGGWLPEWCRTPNDTEQAVLRTLALELATILLPEPDTPVNSRVVHVDDLAAALRHATQGDAGQCVSLKVRTETKSGQLSLVWPVAYHERLTAGEPQPESAAAAVPSSQSQRGSPTPRDTGGPTVGSEPLSAQAAAAPRSAPATVSKSTVFYRDVDEGIAFLPPYTRSLLKVSVPVTVTLACTKQPLSRILDLSPGSIIQFSKACDDTLALEVGDHTVAVGEAVKVGDKFGLWITSMAMPSERFWVVAKEKSEVRAK